MKLYIAAVMVLILVTGVLGLQTNAHAIPILTLSDGTTTISVTDGGSGDWSSLAGAVIYNGTIGNWTVNVSTGLTKPIFDDSSGMLMDLNSVNVSSVGGGSLTISFIETGFTGGAGNIFFNVGGTTTGTASFEAMIGTDSELFEGDLPGYGTYPTGNFSGITYLSNQPEDEYSLKIVAVIDHTTGIKNTSFNATLFVPEPTTLLLLGFGLVGLAGLRRRFKK